MDVLLTHKHLGKRQWKSTRLHEASVMLMPLALQEAHHQCCHTLQELQFLFKFLLLLAATPHSA
jgi:hypothetical protein